jgi:hypothetical protein
MGPPFPGWGFGPRTPTLLCYRDCGDRTFNPALVIWKKIAECWAPVDSHTSLWIWRRVSQGGAALATERISLHDPPRQECTNKEYLTLIVIFCQFLLVPQYYLQRAWPPAGLTSLHALSSEFTWLWQGRNN